MTRRFSCYSTVPSSANQPKDPQFWPCTQTLGTYTDYIASNFTTVAPHGSTTEVFKSTNMTGIGSYTIRANAPLFATDSGRIMASYMEYDSDPNNGGAQASGDIEISAAASVTSLLPSLRVCYCWLRGFSRSARPRADASHK